MPDQPHFCRDAPAAPVTNSTQIAANLARFDRIAAEQPGARRAAVAITLAPLASGREAIGFILTKRSYSLRRGAGQYALPGGHIEPDESVEAAALRELDEELGVRLPPSSLIGMLDDLVTRSGHIVTPIVLWAETPPILVPAPAEVHEAWLRPLDDLARPDTPRWRPGEDGGPDIPQMCVGGAWINPPTAAILYQFREVALYGRVIRVAEVGQPSWTAR
jgi:8-oxo-dGTP pyrophosphatase MutT (NUDIX family)